jgi:NADH dehydrogenase (ubiquinone) Fe-S protein 4
MDGSEPGESLAAAVLSGAPTDLQARTVRYVLRVSSHTA